jgi:hypothetical protein
MNFVPVEKDGRSFTSRCYRLFLDDKLPEHYAEKRYSAAALAEGLEHGAMMRDDRLHRFLSARGIYTDHS